MACKHSWTFAFGESKKGVRIYDYYICSIDDCRESKKEKPNKKQKGYYEGQPLTQV